MSKFDTALAGFRQVETMRGDTLQRVALRELGDASLWVDLALLNDLRSPYIVDDAALLADGVVLAGSAILAPAASAVSSASVDPVDVFGADVAVVDGLMAADDGDFALAAGVRNIAQAMTIRINVEKGELPFHPEYGCYLRSLLGSLSGPTKANVAAFYARSALLEDDRVAAVPLCEATVAGDALRVEAKAELVAARSIDVTITV